MIGDSVRSARSGNPDRVPRHRSRSYIHEPLDAECRVWCPFQCLAQCISDGLTGCQQGGLGEFFHAPGEVVVERPVGHATLRHDLGPPGRGVALIAQQRAIVCTRSARESRLRGTP